MIIGRLCLFVFLAFGLLPLTACRQVAELFDRPSMHMPAYHPVDVQTIKQNWSPTQQEFYYHSSQGTELMPYKWFLALEQPQLKLFGTIPKFSDPGYLARFGFLPDPNNPAQLPVGFAVGPVVDPASGETLQAVGLTCAACHTGQVEYQGKGIRINGGSGAVDLSSFQTELEFAVGLTDKIPFRFDRFAAAVLGDRPSAEDKQKLRQQFDQFTAAGQKEKQLADDRHLYPPAGFGRTDALARIGNLVFGTELDNANLAVANAPVNFPPLWYTSWFGWVQYNGSIQQPMIRNIGEALGVRGRVNLTDPGKLYQSTVNVSNLWLIERQLAGPQPFAGLQSPSWPEELLGPIDRQKAQKGAQLYQAHCERCHLPVLDSPEIQKDQYWEPGMQGKRFLHLNVIPLEVIGTDPLQATNWAQRTAVTGALGLGTVPAKVALRAVTLKIRDLNYDTLHLSPDDRLEWSGYRADGVDSPLGYRARPLAGLWATPPFLHNGSVPSLYQLLLPADQRDKSFYVGSREFDPVNVGYATARFDGAYEYRTDQPGNSNHGHEFSNKPGKGVIGPELSEEDRRALIEYLKSL
jgi:hypothetical protein